MSSAEQEVCAFASKDEASKCVTQLEFVNLQNMHFFHECERLFHSLVL